jgi:hypothetical protein
MMRKNMPAEKSDRVCLIDPGKGEVSVRLKVDNDLMCGGDFRIQEADRKLFNEQWKMAVDDGRSISKTVNTKPDELNNQLLIWQLLICAKDPQIYEGFVQISVSQQGVACKINIPARWEFDNIPPCAINKSTQLTSSLTFIVKK